MITVVHLPECSKMVDKRWETRPTEEGGAAGVETKGSIARFRSVLLSNPSLSCGRHKGKGRKEGRLPSKEHKREGALLFSLPILGKI